jgi:molybdopterin converting factor subunit 1
MTLTLIYFAAFRDLTGQNEEVFSEVPEQTTVREFRELARKKYPAMRFDGVRVAVNEEFENDDHVLNDSDVIAFIPPVAGG